MHERYSPTVSRFAALLMLALTGIAGSAHGDEEKKTTVETIYVHAHAGYWKGGEVPEVERSDDHFVVFAPQRIVVDKEIFQVIEFAVGFRTRSRNRVPRQVRFELETEGCFVAEIGLRNWRAEGASGEAAVIDTFSVTRHCQRFSETLELVVRIPRRGPYASPYIDARRRFEVRVMIAESVAEGQEGEDRNVDVVSVDTDF